MRPCKHCEKEIPGSKKKKQVFCSVACSNASRITDEHRCVECSAHITNKAATRCNACNVERMEKEAKSRPLSSFFNHSASRAKNNRVRHWARKLIKREGRPEECEECGFDVYIEVCHLRPITDFPEDTLMGVVNALDNLKYLCPNHHAMLDRGLLRLSSHRLAV